MKIPFINSEDKVNIKTLQKEINEITQKLDEKEDEINDYLMATKSYSDSSDSQNNQTENQLLDKASLQELYTSETWFYIAVSTIAETIASLPFKLEKKKITKQNIVSPNGDTEEVYKETWIDAGAEPEAILFKYPNGFQTRYDFWYNIVADLLSTGESFIFAYENKESALTNNEDRLRNAISRVRKTNVDALIRINSAVINAVSSTEENKIISHYEISSEGKDIIFKCDEIIQFKIPNPKDHLQGLAPIAPVLRKVLLDRYTDEHHIRFYKQGAKLGGVIETAKKLTKDQMSRLTSTFESKFGGKKQHHKTLILPEGMKYSPIEVSPIQSSLIEFSKNNKEPILAVYKVPPIKVGLLDGATFANANIQNKTYYENAIKPITSLIEEGINSSEKILRSSRNLRFKFDFSDIVALQEDFKIKAESATSMLNGGLTFNEVRELVWKKGPVEGGNIIQGLNTQSPLGSLFNLSANPKNHKEVADVQSDTESLSDINPTNVSFEQRVGQLIHIGLSNGLDLHLATTRAIQQAIQEGFKPIEEGEKNIKSDSPFSKEFLIKYSKIVSGEDVDPFIEEYKKYIDSFFGRLQKFILGNLKNVAYKHEKSFKIKTGLPSEKEFKVFINKEIPNYVEALDNAIKYGYKNNIPSQTISFPNEDALKVLEDIAAKRVTYITDTARKQIKNIVTTAVSEQVSVTELRARIQDAFKNINEGRAYTIARTETLTGVSIGQNLKTEEFKRQFPEESKKMKRVWITAQDEKVRDTHIANDGKVVEVGKSFPNGLKFPRDPNGEASEVINCRCSFIDFMPEDTDSILSSLGSPSELADVKVTRKPDESYDECVNRAIPKLIDEGHSQDQAAAMAYSMCKLK